MVNRPPHRTHEWPCSGPGSLAMNLRGLNQPRCPRSWCPSWARGQSRALSTCLCRRAGRHGEHLHARRAGKVELRPRAAVRRVQLEGLLCEHAAAKALELRDERGGAAVAFGGAAVAALPWRRCRCIWRRGSPRTAWLPQSKAPRSPARGCAAPRTSARRPSSACGL